MPETTPTPSWEYSLSLPNDLRAVPISRRTLRLILTMYGLIHLVDTAELIASELVSNAVLHTKGPAALRVSWADGVLRIGAWDANPEPPDAPRDMTELTGAENGRGTALVRACADVWGWHPLSRFGHRGKYVWCDLPAA
ncbi:ATP-binding protein [Streptomyces bobili]|uniref:ATP-binding protein n=1 Tax=Streptomyces bobili TaxID=67280 RepID=UPI00380932C2